MAPDPHPIPAWLGVDLGTSAVKALLVDADGRILGRAREPLPLDAGSGLRAEQDARDWWAAAARAIAACVGAHPSARVEAVGLTGQKHALLPLGADGEPLARAWLWADGRARAEAASLARSFPRLARATGSPALPGYLVPKWMRWSAGHPSEAARVRHLCSAKDYLRLRLTGGLATDPTEASASQLWDASRRSWSRARCEAFGVPARLLPPVAACVQVTGGVRSEAAAATGLAAGTPVVAGAGDNEAAALACGALVEGTVAVVLGTSGTVVAPAARRRGGRGLVWGRSVLRRGALATGVVLSAGRALTWIRDAAFPAGTTVEDVLAAAASVEDEEELPLFLPSLIGERSPRPDPDASGVLAGLRPHHGRAHLALAVRDGVAATLGEVVLCLRRAGIRVERLRVTSGGAASRRLCELVAAAARAPAARMGGDEGPSLGAALLARCAEASDARVVETARHWLRPGTLEPPADGDQQRMTATRERLDALRRACTGP